MTTGAYVTLAAPSEPGQPCREQRPDGYAHAGVLVIGLGDGADAHDIRLPAFELGDADNKAIEKLAHVARYSSVTWPSPHSRVNVSSGQCHVFAPIRADVSQVMRWHSM